MQLLISILTALAPVIFMFSIWGILYHLHIKAMKKEEKDYLSKYPQVGKKIRIPKSIEDTLDPWEKKIS